MKTGLRRIGGGLRMGVVLTLWTTLAAGSASAGESFTLSKFSDFSANNRFYSVEDTLYMRVVAADLDPTQIETAEFTLTPHGNGVPVSGVFDNHLDGTYTASFVLAELEGKTRSWEWRARISDDDDHEIEVEANLVIHDVINLPEVFELRGQVEEISAGSIVVSGHVLEVDNGTQVFAGQGVRLRLEDLQVGDPVTVMVKEDLSGRLRALQIFIEGEDGAELKLFGRIEQIVGDSLVVAGVTVLVNDHTLIRGRHGSELKLTDLEIGMRVRVEARLQSDGTWLALKIRVRDQDDNDEESEIRGVVEEVGSSYVVVAGIRFEVNGQTEFEDVSGLADLVVGDRVEIEFVLRADGSLLAEKIELKDDDRDDAEIEVHGTITALTDTTVVVNGITFVLTGDTEIEGEDHHDLSPGDLYTGLPVEVKGRQLADGRIVAVRIKIEDDLKTEMEIKGFVEALTDTSLRVAGLWIQVTAETEVEGDHHSPLRFSDLQVGMFVEVKLRIGLDSTLVALRIEIEDHFDEDDVEITGAIDSLASDAIVVSGHLFAVDAATAVLSHDKTPIDFASLRVGQVVKVKARRLADGTLLAREIRLKNRVHADAEIEGPVTALQDDSLQVAGIWLEIGSQTIFQGRSSLGDLAVGDWVEVHYRVLPDGSRLALRIKVENRPGSEVEFSGAIERIGDSDLTVAGVSVLVSATTEIRDADGAAISLGDLSIGQTVKVHATLTADGLVAREIEVKHTLVIAASVESSGPASLTLAGHQVAIDDHTLIVGRNNVALTTDDLQPGTFVEVIAVALPVTGLGKTAGTEALAEKIEVKQAATLTGLSSETSLAVPAVFTLEQNYPNPFNPETTIRFVLKTPARVTLRVYNLLGQEVRTLLSAPLAAGSYQVQWNGLDQSGHRAASGVYILRMSAGDQTQSRRMVLSK